MKKSLNIEAESERVLLFLCVKVPHMLGFGLDDNPFVLNQTVTLRDRRMTRDLRRKDVKKIGVSIRQ